MPVPLRRAHVAIALNASDHNHFTVSGERPFREACPPWATLTFLADYDIPEALEELLRNGGVDAVVFGSNALIGAASQRAIASDRYAALWNDDGPARDVGVVVLHQYLRPRAMLPLEFLGSAALSLVGQNARRVEADDIRFSFDWRFVAGAPVGDRDERFLALSRGYGRERACVWTGFDFKFPGEWQRLAWEDGGKPLVAMCDAGVRIVVASRVPIDLTGAPELLGSMIAACLRPRGCLLVEAPETTSTSAFSTALASALDRDRFVHRVRPSSAAEIDPSRSPYQFFDELIVAPEWPVDRLASLTEESVLGKLEKGGSIVATFTGPAGPVATRLGGQPQYAQRANRLAAWLVPRLEEFQGDIWSMRALTEAVVATRTAFVHDELIPQALRADFVRRHLADHLAARVTRDSVDDIVLATVGAYAALDALGEPELGGMRGWIDEHLDDEEQPSVVAQALVLVPALKTQERLDRVRAALRGDGEAGSEDDGGLLRAFAAMLFADEEPDLLNAAATDGSLGLGVQSELLRTAVRRRVPAEEAIVDVAAHVRAEVDRLAGGDGALEAICLGNAALIDLARSQGVAPPVAARHSPGAVDARTVANTELVKDREAALRQAAEARKAGRLAVSALTGLLCLITVVAIAVIVIWSEGDPGRKFGFATGVFGLMSTFIGYVVKKARDAGIPPWPG